MEDVDDLNVTKSRLLWAGPLVRGYELLPACGLGKRGYVNEDTNLGFTQPSISQITFKHMLSSINTISGISCYFTGRSADNEYKDMCRSVVPVSILVPPGLQFIFSYACNNDIDKDKSPSYLTLVNLLNYIYKKIVKFV